MIACFFFLQTICARMISFSPSFLFYLLSLFLVIHAVKVSTVEVGTVEDLLNAFNGTEDRVDVNITLKNDLDFKNLTWDGLPLGNKTGECKEYSGHFDGGNYTIRNLVLNSTDSSGLFCGLVNATIKNLIIGSTCSFSGEKAGALSPEASESLSVVNVINYASVNSSFSSGGIIGRVITTLPSSSVLFDKCRNYRDLFGQSHVGGIVGSMKLKGGETKFIDCENNGALVSTGDGRGNYSAGGLVGSVDECASPIVVDGCINRGTVQMDRTDVSSPAGGLFGSVSFVKASSFSVSNSMNIGSVSGPFAAGFYTTNKLDHGHFTVINCVNKGTISGTNVYGIGDTIHQGDFVISMGNLSNSTSSYPFCENNVGNYSELYIEDHVKEGPGPSAQTTSFIDMILQKCYRVRPSTTCLKKTLNLAVIILQYRKLWTDRLYLIDAISVVIGAPIHKTVYLENETAFGKVADYGNISFDGFYPIERDTWTNIGMDTKVNNSIEVALCHRIVLSGDDSREWFQEPGTLLSANTIISQLCQDPKKVVLVNSTDHSIEYPLNHVIVSDMNITALRKYSVQIGEPVNGVEYVFVNATYGSIAPLVKYLQDPHYLVFENNDSSVVLKESSVVFNDSVVTIKRAIVIDIVLELNNTSKSGDVIDYMEDYVKGGNFSIGHVEVIDQGDGVFSITVSVVDDQLDDFWNPLAGCVVKE